MDRRPAARSLPSLPPRPYPLPRPFSYERELQPESVGLESHPQLGRALEEPGLTGLSYEQMMERHEQLPIEARRAALAAALADPRDRATPRAATRFLTRLHAGELLSPSATKALVGIMLSTQTGKNKLRASLPAGYRFANKTGSGATVLSTSIADNDIGLIYLPGGRVVAVAVFTSGSTLTWDQRGALIADIGRAVIESVGPAGEASQVPQ